jgi:serine/threonine protein kinase
MAELAELGSILVGARVISRSQWEKAAAQLGPAGGGVNGLLAILVALAAEPPHWWDGKTPAPPGLTDYQQAIIRSRFVDDELHLLRRDLALNQFLILSKLGQGGQGEVYRSRQLNPPRYAAIKTLVRDTEVRRRRFEQEARAMLKIQHPAVARFFLYERIRDSNGDPTDEYLIAMEFVSGNPLHRFVHRNGPVPWKFAVHWSISLLGGLSVIHKSGFVHGDVKPENVMVIGPTPGPGLSIESTGAKLLDFGAAKRLDGADDDAGAVKRTFVGTPEYAPPEQWSGRIVPESDLYALGGTLFFMLTGRFPYHKDKRDPMAYRASHTSDPVPDVRKFNADVPAELGDVIARMMAKAVEDRGSAEQLSAALRRLLPKESAAPESSRMAIKKPAPLATRITDSASEPLVPDERHPIYLRADGFLAFLERWFIPGHVRMPPGEEGPIPERIAGLLRRPLVLGLAFVMTAVFLYMFFWVNSLLRVE